MTSKKANGAVATNEWALTLPSQQALVNESIQAYQAALARRRPLSKGEERVIVEGEKQRRVIEYEGIKAYSATQENARVHELGREALYNLATRHSDQIEQVVGTQIENPIRQYAMYDLDALARQQQKIIEMLNQKLNDVITRDVYVADEPEVVVVEKERPPRGLIERIFGGPHEGSE